MHIFLKRLGVACTGTLLLACADLRHQVSPPAPSGPAATAAASGALANEAYLTGRSAHMAKRFGEAITSYQAALLAQPRHVNARNGLATLYAEQGEFAKAVALWETLTADSGGPAGPQTAFLFSNLGYALFLNGDYQKALGALERACVLDPLNYRAWQHLGNALDKLGQHERAKLMQRQAVALQQHDFKADYAAVAGSGVAAIDAAVQAPERAGLQWAETQVHRSGDGMLELRRVEAGGAAHPAMASSVAPAVAGQAPHSASGALYGSGALLEIRNGNGVTGMARAVAGQLDGDVQVVRLSNQKGFGVKRTRVEYQSEFRDAAERLAERFGAATVIEVSHVGRADVRLVIGHDLIAKKPGPDTLAARRGPATAALNRAQDASSVHL